MRKNYSNSAQGHHSHEGICVKTIDTNDLLALGKVRNQEDDKLLGSISNAAEFQTLCEAHRALQTPAGCLLCKRLKEVRSGSVPTAPEGCSFGSPESR